MNKHLIIALFLSVFLLFVSCDNKKTFNTIIRSKTFIDENLLSNGYDLNELQERYNVSLEIDNETNLSTIIGSFDDIKISNESDALIALSYFRKVLNIKDFEYCCEVRNDKTNETVYTAIQLYNNIPIYNSGFDISVNQNGNLAEITGSYINNIECKAEYHISEREAREVINNDINIESYELMIYKNDKKCIPVWYLNVNKNDKKSYMVLNAVNRIIIEYPNFN